MTDAWIDAAPTIGWAILLLLVPGTLVVVAGWGIRRVAPLLFAPAVSLALIAAAALLAPLAGLDWSLIPLAALTAIASGVALGIRLWRPDPSAGRDRSALFILTLIATAVAVGITIGQFALAFGYPDDIAQRFDNVVHLNTVRFAIETANASPLHIGATSDIPFYPNGWHALTALTATLTGASVPIAVNAANLAVVSALWVFSTVALGSALFPARRLAIVAAAALSTGFGAFPALFFNWGVLYPNAVGYATIPAALAAVVLLLRARRSGDVVRYAVLLATITTGTFLAHPNAFVSFFVLGCSYVLGALAVRAATRRTRPDVLLLAGGALGMVLAGLGLWRVASTNASVWGWTPWQGSLGALFDALTATPRGYGMTIALVLAIVIGIAEAARRPRNIPIVLPFVAAVILFTLAAGVTADNPVRAWLTDPWYGDPNRLAALLPIATIPVATLGVVTLGDLLRRLASSSSRISRRTRLHPRAYGWAGIGIAGIALFTVAGGPNVQSALAQVNEAYRSTPDALLLSSEERLLLERLDQSVPSDSVILASPRTGASLAYAYTGTEVTEKHIFGARTDDEKFLSKHLSDIGGDPEVCAAVVRNGVEYVLDFGDRDVWGDAPDTETYGGIQNLQPSDHLVLVDAEGDSARLFEIRGCR